MHCEHSGNLRAKRCQVCLRHCSDGWRLGNVCSRNIPDHTAWQRHLIFVLNRQRNPITSNVERTSDGKDGGEGREKVSQYHLKSLHCLKLKISGCVSVLHRISSWIASLDSGSLDVVLCVAQDQQGCDIAAQKPGKRSRWCSNTPCKPAAAQCLVKNPSSESLFTQRRTRPWYMGLKSAWDVRAVTVFIKASLCLEAESL